MICASVSSPVAWREAPNGLGAASTAYGKNYFHPALMEPRDLPSFNAVKITRQTSPNQARKDKRRLKTIFNHFRDKPARLFFSFFGVTAQFHSKRRSSETLIGRVIPRVFWWLLGLFLLSPQLFRRQRRMCPKPRTASLKMGLPRLETESNRWNRRNRTLR